MAAVLVSVKDGINKGRSLSRREHRGKHAAPRRPSLVGIYVLILRGGWYQERPPSLELSTAENMFSRVARL
jgi:hypothetical protein